MSASTTHDGGGRAGEILVEAVTKRFGDVVAVNDVSITIPGGEFFSMLGPSGCGKTTTLRMIAGFEAPDAGRIVLQGADVTHVPPPKRNVNMVFQAYGLFPHMTVGENVAFGPKIKKWSREETRERVAEAIRTVRLDGFEDRRPGQLSGGQQQRVALARALVNRPAALLLDEPLGALDLKLRKEMQLELKALQREVGITFVYVTHDQEEALTMSDVIVVMKDGLVQQQGGPTELYERPVNRFVADFIGTSNFIDATVAEFDASTATVTARTPDGLVLRGRLTDATASAAVGDAVTIATRPERLAVVPDSVEAPAGTIQVSGRITQGTYLGDQTEYRVNTQQAGELIVRHQNAKGAGGAPGAGPGDQVVVRWHEEANLVLAG